MEMFVQEECLVVEVGIAVQVVVRLGSIVQLIAVVKEEGGCQVFEWVVSVEYPAIDLYHR